MNRAIFFGPRTKIDPNWELVLKHITSRIPGLFCRQSAAASERFSALINVRNMLTAGQWAEEKTIEVVRHGTPYNGNRRDLSVPFSQGFTIVANNYNHAAFNPMRIFVHGLTHLLEMPVKVNAFLTPPHHVGYPWHFDGRDILVLQVFGSKQWEFSDPVSSIPIEGQEMNSAPRKREKVSLKAGDMFFLPAGFPHRATAGTEASLHLTINLLPIRRFEVLQRAIQRSANQDISLRSAWAAQSEDVTACTRLFSEDFGGDIEDAYHDLTHRWVCNLPRVTKITPRPIIEDLRDSIVRRSPDVLVCLTGADVNPRLSVGGLGQIRDDPIVFNLSKEDVEPLLYCLKSEEAFNVRDMQCAESTVGPNIIADLMSVGLFELVT
jgi:Cupin superfamily protein